MAVPARHLQVVEQATSEQALTDEVAVLHEQLAGADRELRAWRSRYARLEADVEAEAKADPLAERVFCYWQAMTDHPKAELTPLRYRMLSRHLKRKGGLLRALRAIAGARSDAWRHERGLDQFEDLFKSQKGLEYFESRCPADWTPPASAMELL